MSRFARIVEDPEYLDDEDQFPEFEWDQAFAQSDIPRWSDAALDRLMQDLTLEQEMILVEQA
jgi:hypothetical protein